MKKTAAQLAASARWRERNREASRERARKWRAENKARHQVSLYKWASLNPEKAAAAAAVRYAVLNGTLRKHLCWVCGDERTEGHHWSYSREHWLDVVWLCKKHHREIHGNGQRPREARYQRRWTPDMVADAAGMRNSGMKWDDIGAKYGVCGATVKQVIGSRGVRVQSFSRWGPRKEGSRYFSK